MKNSRSTVTKKRRKSKKKEVPEDGVKVLELNRSVRKPTERKTNATDRSHFSYGCPPAECLSSCNSPPRTPSETSVQCWRRSWQSVGKSRQDKHRCPCYVLVCWRCNLYPVWAAQFFRKGTPRHANAPWLRCAGDNKGVHCNRPKAFLGMSKQPDHCSLVRLTQWSWLVTEEAAAGPGSTKAYTASWGGRGLPSTTLEMLSQSP